MSGIAAGLEKQYPDTNKNSGVVVNSLSAEIGRTGSMQVATGFVVGLCILLIACSNIAGMYLSRTMSRGKEMTVRLALGAKKGFAWPGSCCQKGLLLVPVAIGIGLTLTWYGGKLGHRFHSL